MKIENKIHENGSIFAEKNWDVHSRILYVDDTSVLMQGKQRSYVVQIHKGLKPYMNQCEESDTGFIKFRNDGGWLVGFQKLKTRFLKEKMSEKYPLETWVDANGDLDIVSYFRRKKSLDELYSDYEVEKCY